MTIKQSDAVVKYTKQVLGDNFRSGVPAASYVTKAQRDEIVELLYSGFVSGEIGFSANNASKYSSDKELRQYVRSLVANHFIKNLELNGGLQYKPTNSGSRTGNNPSLKERKKQTINVDQIPDELKELLSK